MDEQRAWAAGGAEALQQLHGGDAGSGDDRGIDAPHAGDVLARGRVVDHPVARQLVGLLAVLAAALPVALPGDGAVAAPFGAHQAEGQGEVDGGGDRVGAVDVLLGAAAGEHERAPATTVRRCVGEQVGDAPQLGLRTPLSSRRRARATTRTRCGAPRRAR